MQLTFCREYHHEGVGSGNQAVDDFSSKLVHVVCTRSVHNHHALGEQVVFQTQFHPGHGLGAFRLIDGVGFELLNRVPLASFGLLVDHTEGIGFLAISQHMD